MSQFQSWQWPSDEVPLPEIVPFSRSLGGAPAQWEALFFRFSPDLPQLESTLSRFSQTQQSRESLLTRLSRNQLRLRPAGSDDSFCICDSEGDAESPRLSRSLDSWQIRMICADAFTSSKVARLFYLNSVGRLRERGEESDISVLVRSNGRGLWAMPRDDTPYNASAPFQLFADEGVAAFLRRPALDVWHELEKALADPQSDAFFARQWVQKSEEQRQEALWKWAPDSRPAKRAEFQDWLRCALLCQDSLWQQRDCWNLSVPDPDNIWLYSEEEWEENTIPRELRHMVERLWQHYSPFDSDVLRHECAYNWKQNRMETFQVEVCEPTAHERLEAMLCWRDWRDEHGE